ncbi:MAG: S8 family serine peptidase [Lachnospiraceae bacterium]|nr:S8 family serine peptidase [Lachnospiraceae bacterium]
MENQKLENQLSLALDVDSQLRATSQNLNTGYDAVSQRWELIVKHSGNLSRYATEEIQIEELIAGYAIVILPERMIPAFAQIEEIEYIEKPKRIYPQVETAFAASCFSDVLPIGQDGKGLSGEDIYIAVIDSGIDYKLPVFRNADGTTRIDWLFDQGKGTEYTREEIDENLEAGESAIPLSTDVTGHGTKVASIAAQGAPGSRFIIVKLNTENQESYPATTSLMRAFNYVVKKAAGAGIPVAINLSFGNTYGSHDGTSLLERFIDNISEIGRNVICVGSGNEGASAGHFSAQIEETTRVEFAVGNYESGLSLQIWKNYADIYRITIISPAGESYRIGQQAETGGAQQIVLEQTRLLIYSGKPQPYRTKEEIYLDFLPDGDGSRYVNRGVWQIVMDPDNVVNGNVQMYLPSEVVRSSATRFLLPNPNVTLTIPATAQKVITVGAYQTFFGAYADFSGRGFAVNATEIGEGLAKPDIVAPGVNLRVRGSEGIETVSGTSYAAPFVTAAAALLMEWGIVKENDPYLYGEKVKAYLIRGARRLPGYDQWPNDMTGWGALCVRDSFPI